MRGFPKHLNTKADYSYVLNNFSEEQCRPDIEKLLSTRKAYLPVKELGVDDAGQVSETMRVDENERSDGSIERIQMQLKDDHSSKLLRLGFAKGEFEFYE